MVIPAPRTNTEFLKDTATRLRIDSVKATTEAGSGHVTSCASAAEIMSVLFFSVMRYDPRDPDNEDNDRFILSKGHAAPLLYAAWAEAGFLPKDELLRLRRFESDLEGHPTPRLPFVDAATGALGQGLAVGAGEALAARLDGRQDQQVYVLMGDGETTEGAVWETAAFAAEDGLSHLCAIVDVNGFGQSEPAPLGHDLSRHRARWEGFGWRVLEVDGHDIDALLEAFEQTRNEMKRPSVVLATTIKGKDLPPVEGENVHGKPLQRGEETEQVIRRLESALRGAKRETSPNLPAEERQPRRPTTRPMPAPHYELGKDVATRQAFGDALAALADVDPRVVTLDGDVKNSTKTQEFEAVAPDRFIQSYIAEQAMVGMGMGLAARGKIPFATTFACFLTRAFDFIRLAAISRSNLKFAGSHAGVSIGADGPSQMGLEDIAMFCAEPGTTVLYPSDANAAWRAVELAAATEGIVYIRTNRPKTSVIYEPGESFEVGKCKTLRRSDEDQVTLVAAGVTLLEALEAYEKLLERNVRARVIDLFSVKPIDRETLLEAARATDGRILTVEDHYAHGGLGDAVLSALAGERIQARKLAVHGIPRSGEPEQLFEHFGISARHIAEEAEALAR